MRVILTGGGTGGHLTPLVAIAHELRKKIGPEIKLLYVGSGAKMEKQIMSENGIPTKFVLSGKMRRYFSFQNFVDFFKIPIGFFQSLVIFSWWMPRVARSPCLPAKLP